MFLQTQEIARFEGKTDILKNDGIKFAPKTKSVLSTSTDNEPISDTGAEAQQASN